MNKMTVLHALTQLLEAIESEDTVKENELLDTQLQKRDIAILSRNAKTLRDLLVLEDTNTRVIDDKYSIVIDQYSRNAHKTTEECICRICEEFNIDMNLNFTNRTIASLENTD